jgi:uncharacterized protein
MKIKYYSFMLCLVCIGMFLAQLLISGFTELLLLNQSSFFEPWRFVTAIFLHGGLGHLLYNLFALALFGFILEKTIGSEKFLLVFFVSGIIANLISINFYTSSLGASGAIMGVIGTLAIIKPLMMVWALGMILPMFVAAILWIVGDILGIFIQDGVGNIAHLSGMGIGILIGIFLRFGKKKNKAEMKFKIPDYYIENWEDNYMR